METAVIERGDMAEARAASLEESEAVEAILDRVDDPDTLQGLAMAAIRKMAEQVRPGGIRRVRAIRTHVDTVHDTAMDGFAWKAHQ